MHAVLVQFRGPGAHHERAAVPASVDGALMLACPCGHITGPRRKPRDADLLLCLHVCAPHGHHDERDSVLLLPPAPCEAWDCSLRATLAARSASRRRDGVAPLVAL